MSEAGYLLVGFGILAALVLGALALRAPGGGGVRFTVDLARFRGLLEIFSAAHREDPPEGERGGDAHGGSPSSSNRPHPAAS